jgi:hypothetical protein
MNAHFPQNELARAEAYGIGKLQVSISCSLLVRVHVEFDVQN